MVLLCAASRGRPAGWAGALGVGRRLAARSWIGLVIIGPVVKAGGEAGAACLAAAPRGVVVQGGRPQVGVVKVVRHTVGGELAFRPRGPGRRMKEGVLIKKQADWSEAGQGELGNKRSRKEGRLTMGEGLAHEYSSLLYRHSSVSLQLAM